MSLAKSQEIPDSGSAESQKAKAAEWLFEYRLAAFFARKWLPAVYCVQGESHREFVLQLKPQGRVGRLVGSPQKNRSIVFELLS